VKIAIRPSEAEEATPLELEAFRCAVRADGQRGFRMVRVKAKWAATSNSLVSASAMPF